jgi:hypothetical protein
MMLSQKSIKLDGYAKSAKYKARHCRAMRRTCVRRSSESNGSNAAVGEFLRRHHL